MDSPLRRGRGDPDTRPREPLSPRLALRHRGLSLQPLPVLVALLILAAPTALAERAEVRANEFRSGCETDSGDSITEQSNGTHTSYTGPYWWRSECESDWEVVGLEVESAGFRVVSASLRDSWTSEAHDEGDFNSTSENGPCEADFSCPYTYSQEGAYTRTARWGRTLDASLAGRDARVALDECESRMAGEYQLGEAGQWSPGGYEYYRQSGRETSESRTRCVSYVHTDGFSVLLTECDTERTREEWYDAEGYSVPRDSRSTSDAECFRGPQGGATVSGTGTSADGTGAGARTGVASSTHEECERTAPAPQTCSSATRSLLVLGLGATAAGGWVGAGGEMPLP